jgi:hypothetical protein
MHLAPIAAPPASLLPGHFDNLASLRAFLAGLLRPLRKPHLGMATLRALPASAPLISRFQDGADPYASKSRRWPIGDTIETSRALACKTDGEPPRDGSNMALSHSISG